MSPGRPSLSPGESVFPVSVPLGSFCRRSPVHTFAPTLPEGWSSIAVRSLTRAVTARASAAREAEAPKPGGPRLRAPRPLRSDLASSDGTTAAQLRNAGVYVTFSEPRSLRHHKARGRCRGEFRLKSTKLNRRPLPSLSPYVPHANVAVWSTPAPPRPRRRQPPIRVDPTSTTSQVRPQLPHLSTRRLPAQAGRFLRMSSRSCRQSQLRAKPPSSRRSMTMSKARSSARCEKRGKGSRLRMSLSPKCFFRISALPDSEKYFAQRIVARRAARLPLLQPPTTPPSRSLLMAPLRRPTPLAPPPQGQATHINPPPPPPCLLHNHHRITRAAAVHPPHGQVRLTLSARRRPLFLALLLKHRKDNILPRRRLLRLATLREGFRPINVKTAAAAAEDGAATRRRHRTQATATGTAGVQIRRTRRIAVAAAAAARRAARSGRSKRCSSRRRPRRGTNRR